MEIEQLRLEWDKRNEEHKRNKDNEHRLQVTCVRWFRMCYPDLLIYAIPNGGQRSIAVAKKLKAEGATAGIPDLHIPFPCKGYASLYIEMKNGNKGRLSERQEIAREKLQALGNKVVVCRTFEDFEKAVKEYVEKP